MEGFYKQIEGNWIYAKEAVYSLNYTLLKSERETLDLPIDGWDWYDESPIVSDPFDDWTERMNAVKDIRELLDMAPDERTFLEDNKPEISSFATDGDAQFLFNVIDCDVEALIDKREAVIDILLPLVILEENTSLWQRFKNWF